MVVLLLGCLQQFLICQFQHGRDTCPLMWYCCGGGGGEGRRWMRLEREGPTSLHRFQVKELVLRLTREKALLR